MEETLIQFETAILAKEKGFNINTKYQYQYIETKKLTDEHDFYHIEGDFSRSNLRIASNYYASGCSQVYLPTQSLLQKWIREVHNLHIYIDTTPIFDRIQEGSKYKCTIKLPFQPFRWTTAHYYLANTYEQVLEIGLLEALKLIK